MGTVIGLTDETKIRKDGGIAKIYRVNLDFAEDLSEEIGTEIYKIDKDGRRSNIKLVIVSYNEESDEIRVTRTVTRKYTETAGIEEQGKPVSSVSLRSQYRRAEE